MTRALCLLAGAVITWVIIETGGTDVAQWVCIGLLGLGAILEGDR
jgi:hypothetical protein